ncbi:MAG: M42 family peptidase [Planctomycetes bacterium]|nr:M42 family peptidase [Planctomycetota bacterium]
MDKNKIADILKTLTQADGLSGRETAVAALIRDMAAPYCETTQLDPLGSVFAFRRGSANPLGRVMIAAHMDEIGLVVTRVEGGFLHVGRIGGIDPRSCVGQEVTVYPSGPGADTFPDGIHGYIGERPPHLTAGGSDGKGAKLGELRVDTGLSAEALERGIVRVGDPIAIRGGYLELLGGRIAAKALDNRASVTAMIGGLGYLAEARHDWDVIAVATVQEEVGLKGATTSAYGIAPDLAIAIDVTFADTPGLDDTETVEMDKGPAIGWGPNLHPGAVKQLRAVADALEIPYVNEVLPGASGTDAWALQVTRSGIPTALLSIPIRYMHSATEMLVVADVDRTARLLSAFISRLDAGFLDSLVDEV